MNLHDNAWDITLRYRARKLALELVPGFAALLQGLSATMTTSTFASLTTLLTRWVLARRRTVTRMHHDPLFSSRNKVITNWGLSGVVLRVIIELPFRRGHVYDLANLLRLSLNTKLAAKHRRASRTRPDLAVEILELL